MAKRRKMSKRAQAETTITKKSARSGGTKQERRAQKLEKRKKEQKNRTAEMWAAPAPTHLVAKLDQPKVKSKHQSYFEFAENPEKKKKKLEFEVTNRSLDAYPGYAFVPVGDPVLTNACKELSRDQDVMIFIVSSHLQREDKAKISEHVHRTGYYFREAIVDQARQIVGETVIWNPIFMLGTMEPIPESQDEINKQADRAIRDLFPRIPNPDRVMIIEHAFKKGAVFHGEPTVGLQASIPLSRRVQLAVLAHIRHTHTRYDKLLRETTWMNARKAVEPVCLDVLIKWRGDEETGRDQMDEILREVVIITDSEDEDHSSEEDSSDEEGEATSASSTEPPTRPNSRNPPRTQEKPSASTSASALAITTNPISSRTRAKDPMEKKEQRGFKRYQAAWQDAIKRQQAPRSHAGTPYQESEVGRPRLIIANHVASPHYTPSECLQAESSDVHHRPSGVLTNEVNDPYFERAVYYQAVQPQHPESLRNIPSETVLRRPVTTGYSSMDHQPPQVVRRSHAKHSLQDFLVPSIEMVSSDISSPRIQEWNGPRVDAVNDPRVVGSRTQTLAAHPVIVIDDDSPHVKRRRLVREDDSGHLRPFPSRDYSAHVPTSYSDSLTLRSSLSAQNKNIASALILRPPREQTQSTPGLLRDPDAFYTHPGTGERLPIYDAPEPGCIPKRTEYMDRRIGTVQREEHSDGMRPVGPSQPHDDLYDHRPINMQNGRDMPELNARGGRARQPVYNPEHQKRQMSTISHDTSRSYDLDSKSGGPDQDFIQSFSHSRLDGPSLSRDGFTVIPARSQERYAARGNQVRSYEPTIRARSPIKYEERPLQAPQQSQQPAYYNHGYTAREDRQAYHNDAAARLPEPQPTSFGEVPMYVRTIPVASRRPVIYLE